MKKIVISLITTLFLWGADGGIDRVEVFLKLDTGLEAYQYEEKSLMSITGLMDRTDITLGIAVDFLRLQFEGYYVQDMGNNVYKGGISSFNADTNQREVFPYSTRSTDWYAGGNLKIGLSLFPEQAKVHSYMYAGVGYRFLHNDNIDVPGIKVSYPRDQSYLYVPVGLDADIPITDHFSFIGMTEHRFLLKGKNKSGFSKLEYERDLFFTQKEGMGGRIAVGGRYRFQSGVGVQISLYYDYWMIEDSDQQPLQVGQAELIFVEPKNNTKAVGLMAGIIF